MVLYDKKSNFLGISGNELFMLGYESMEEFKSYNDDFADLFVSRPGYISKFKNFSWLDYLLHSGVSNKNVILKHKNDTEIEATLDITEIFLLDEINESNSIYNVNISKLKNDFITTTNTSLKNQNIRLEPVLKELQESSTQEEPTVQTKTDIKDDFSLISDFDIEDYEEAKEEDEKNRSYDDSISIKSEPNIEIKEDILKEVKVTTQEDTEPTIKLKVDMFDDIDDIDDILKAQTPETTYIPEEEIKVKIQDKPSILDKKDHKDIKEANEFNDQYKKIADEDIDFAQIIEDTGIDLEDLAMFMSEFLGEAKKMSEVFHSSKDEKLIKNKIVQLKGIASCLQMISFVKILDMIFSNYNTEKFDNYVNQFNNKIKNLKNQLS